MVEYELRRTFDPERDGISGTDRIRLGLISLGLAKAMRAEHEKYVHGGVRLWARNVSDWIPLPNDP